MYKVTITGQLKPDIKKFTKKLEANIQKYLKGAVKEFLTALILNNVVRVQTGMSRASLLPLAKQVRMYSRLRATIQPTVPQKTFPYTPPASFPKLTPWKSISQGLKIGEKAYTLDLKGPIYLFEFNIMVYQYYLKEHGINGEPGWESLTIGREAFMKYLEENKSSIIPAVADWM